MAETALQAPPVTALAGAAAAAVVWRFQGQLHVTVIAKATFAFAPDADMSRLEPQAILKAETHHGNNPARSVRFTSDLAPYLGQADVLFTGHACSPKGRAVSSMPLRLAIFDGQRFVLDKRLLAQDPAGFQRMPVVYERAARGADGQENPLGVEPSAGEPSVVDPAASPSARAAGFGPIARAWPARKRLLGATPRKALEGAVAEIPDGLDWSYFQAAPLDQRIGSLSGDEWIVLEGLHPALGSLRTRLPGARGRAQIHGLSAFGMHEGQPLDLRIDTLRIDGDEERCTVVARQSFPVASESALAGLWIAAGIEDSGEALEWPDAPPASLAAGAIEPAKTSGPAGTLRILEAPPAGITSAARPASEEPATMALDDDEVEIIEEPALGTMVLSPDAPEPASRPVIPFRAASNVDNVDHVDNVNNVDAAAPQAEAAPPRSGRLVEEQTLSTGTLMLSPDNDVAAPQGPALPFASAAPESSGARSGRPSSIEPDAPAASPAATLALSPNGSGSAAPRPVLPFSEPVRGSAEPRRSTPVPGAPWSGQSASPAPAPGAESATLMLGGGAVDARFQGSMPQASPELSAGGGPAPANAPPDGKPPEASRFFHDVRRMLRPHEEADAPAPLSAPRSSPRSSPLSAPRDTPPDAGESVSLERVAAITAELSERPLPRADVLAAHGLSEARFGSAQKQWIDALDGEQRSGGRALRDRFDAAYVASWEAIRGPIEADAYARLVVAEESGGLSSALEALGLKRTAWMRMKRLWSKRIAESPGLAAIVKKEAAKLRR